MLARAPILTPSALLMRRRRSLPAWTPLTLFLAGEQGGWYDPSDLTTMFQDSAGTTPVTAVEQPVGLWLDKRLGALSALGPEMIPGAAGSFDSSVGWTLASGGGGAAVIGGGTLTLSGGTSNFPNATYSAVLTVGRLYQVTIVVSAAPGSAGALGIRVGGIASNGPDITVPGTYTFTRFADGSDFRFIRNSGYTGSAVIDSVSVREVPGNHLIQPTSASRPTYSKRYNLLERTQEFDNAAWVKGTGGSISANSVVAPDGTMTADAYTWPTTTGSFAYLSQAVAGLPQLPHRFTIYLKVPVGVGSKQLRLSISDVTTSTDNSSNVTVTESWQPFTFTRTSANSTGQIGVGMNVASNSPANGIAAGDVLHVWGADLRRTIHTTMGMPAYQRVTTATDYDESGFLPRLRFDGADDSMYSAASVNFSATDEMTVLAGLTKLSDAATSMAVELSDNSNNNNGTFYLADPVSSTTLRFQNKGTLVASVDAIAAAPVSRVVTAGGKISTDSTVVRVNGAQVAASTSDLGAGNYGNFALFVGRRNNSSLPFNGDIFQLIIRGALTSGATLTSAEQYVAARTGVTLP